MFIQGTLKKDISLSELESLKSSNPNSINIIFDQLDELSNLWKIGGDFYNRSFKILSQEYTMSDETIRESLAYIPVILKRESLEKRILSELGPIKSLDSFTDLVESNYRLLHSPLGKILHITS